MHVFTAPPSANRLRSPFLLSFLGNRRGTFCRAFNVTLPTATTKSPRLSLPTGAAVASPKASPRTITTSVGVEKQSVDGVSNVPPAASRRFKNPEKQTAYDTLLSVLDFEKGRDALPSWYSWHAQDVSPLDGTVAYRTGHDERILAIAYVPDEVKDGEVEDSGVQLVVYNRRENGFRLGFGVRAFDREIIIDHVSFARHERARDQHVFNFSKDFDGDTQAAWYEYLAARKVKPNRYFEKTTIKMYANLRS